MAIDVKAREFSGPIPGENFTSDTKNYPWHRPPEYTDLDTAIEAAFKKLTDEDNSVGVLTMLEYGATIAEVTDMFVTAGIGAGKWSPDFAILLAGPVAHILYLMAKGFDIDCDLGLMSQERPPTKAFFDGVRRVSEKAAKTVTEMNFGELEGSDDMGNAEEPAPEEAPEAPGGFMGMAGGAAPEEMPMEEEMM